jgi:hypothetical protein
MAPATSQADRKTPPFRDRLTVTRETGLSDDVTEGCPRGPDVDVARRPARDSVDATPRDRSRNWTCQNSSPSCRRNSARTHPNPAEAQWRWRGERSEPVRLSVRDRHSCSGYDIDAPQATACAPAIAARSMTRMKRRAHAIAHRGRIAGPS